MFFMSFYVFMATAMGGACTEQLAEPLIVIFNKTFDLGPLFFFFFVRRPGVVTYASPTMAKMAQTATGARPHGLTHW